MRNVMPRSSQASTSESMRVWPSEGSATKISSTRCWIATLRRSSTRPSTGTAGDVLLGQLGRVVEQADHAVAVLGVVLELLQQPDRRDAGADDQHAQVLAARAAQVALEAVEEHPAGALEHEVDARAREHDEAAERELLEEEADRGEHEQAQRRAAQELR